MVFVYVDGDVVNGMAADQSCCAGMCTVWRQDEDWSTMCTLWRHTIDYVTIGVHKNHIYSFNQALGDYLMMVPA
jgi:hypothetical protein